MSKASEHADGMVQISYRNNILEVIQYRPIITYIILIFTLGTSVVFFLALAFQEDDRALIPFGFIVVCLIAIPMRRRERINTKDLTLSRAFIWNNYEVSNYSNKKLYSNKLVIEIRYRFRNDGKDMVVINENEILFEFNTHEIGKDFYKFVNKKVDSIDIKKGESYEKLYPVLLKKMKNQPSMKNEKIQQKKIY